LLSAGADDAAAGGVSGALDVLDRADFPTRPGSLSSWSVAVFLEDAQAPVRPELGPTVAFCRAAHLPAIVAAVRDTEAVPVDRHAWTSPARSSCFTRAARRPQSRRSRGASPRSSATMGSCWPPPCRPCARR